MSTRDSINDITFNEISIKTSDNEDYVNVLNNFQASSVFGGMAINQSIFGGGMDGFIILNDPNPDETNINLPSISALAQSGASIKFSFSTTNELGDEPTTVEELEFYIFNVSIVSSIAPGITKLGSSQSITYRLEFASFESSMANFRNLVPYEEEGYIGKIGGAGGFMSEMAIDFGYFSPTPEGEQDPAKTIDEINTCQEVPLIFPTENGVWFKANHSSYPWGKIKSFPPLWKLIKSSLDHAVPQGEPTNPSFVFFQDFKKWYFQTIGGNFGLFSQRFLNGTDRNGRHNYTFTNDETVYRRAENFKFIKDIDLLGLQELGVFSGSYNLIEPNWQGLYNGIYIDPKSSDPDKDPIDVMSPGERQNMYYHDFMSAGSHLKCSSISYNYRDEFFVPVGKGDGEKIEYESNGILMSDIPIIDLNTDKFLQRSFAPLSDPVYGYFNENYLNKPFETDTESYSVIGGRNNKHMWQTMFDISSLPFTTNSETNEIGIKDVVEKVKKPLRKSKLVYSILKDLKEQWNRYRYTICCDSASPDEFNAMLVGYNSAERDYYTGDDPQGGTESDLNQMLYGPYGISGATSPHLFRYSFVEVETWPKQLVKIMGSATGFIPSHLQSTYSSYYDYVGASLDINPSTGERQIYIPSGITGFNTDGSPYDDKYLGINFSFGASASNPITQNQYNINWDQEFFVIPVEGGKRGLFTAYDLNELVNNRAFTNAGINTMGYDYPEGFDLMPIGGMTAGINLNGMDADEVKTPVPLPEVYMGRVVKMVSMRESDLLTLKTLQEDSDYNGPPDLIEENSEATDEEKLMYLINQIFGTENLPTPLCGATADMFYYEISGDEKKIPTSIERDDLDSRPNILDPANPQPRENESKVVYLFSVENDHDGRCALS